MSVTSYTMKYRAPGELATHRKMLSGMPVVVLGDLLRDDVVPKQHRGLTEQSHWRT